ncbi:uncharacterized protein [Centruroides vittatus]|uniref:uncharacterized protein n=1 Tax=Centruroides vittatus TaxID=120091 RepID=UPI00350F2C7C
MKNNAGNAIQTRIRVFCYLVLLLFLIAQVHSFDYLPDASGVRIASRDVDKRRIKSEKTADEDAKIDENTVHHQNQKREILSERYKQCKWCQNNCPLLPAEDDDMITIKKSALLECDSIVDNFLRKMNRQQTKDCILQNITDDETLQYRLISFRAGEEIELINIKENPMGNFSILSVNDYGDFFIEFRINEKGAFKTKEEIEIPIDIAPCDCNVMVYNGNIYGQYIDDNRIVKYNIETGKFTFGVKIDWDGQDISYL